MGLVNNVFLRFKIVGDGGFEWVFCCWIKVCRFVDNRLCIFGLFLFSFCKNCFRFVVVLMLYFLIMFVEWVRWFVIIWRLVMCVVDLVWLLFCFFVIVLDCCLVWFKICLKCFVLDGYSISVCLIMVCVCFFFFR